VALRVKLHRKLGLLFAVFLMIFVVSGILLQHASELNLDQRTIQSEFLLKIYGVDNLPDPKSFKAYKLKDRRHLVQLDSQIYLDYLPLLKLEGNSEKMVALAELPKNLFLATQHQIYIYQYDLKLVDVLDVPSSIIQMGTLKQQLYIRTKNGISILDNNLLYWSPTKNTAEPPPWSSEVSLPKRELEQVWAIHKQSLLTWTRVIQDIHSGRVLGSGGKYLADLAALALLLLALTGLSMMARRKD